MVIWASQLCSQKLTPDQLECCCLVDKSYPTLCNPIDCSPPGFLSMRFPKQEYWKGLPFPSPGDLPDPGIEPVSPTLQAVSCITGGFFTEAPGKPVPIPRLYWDGY